MNVTFDDAPPPGHINFGVGQPSADLLPVKLIETASADFLRTAQPFEFNYGERQGDRRFREALADFLSRHYGQPARPESLLATSGNSQALAFVCTQHTRPGDTVFVEEPSYFLAFNILRDHGLKLVGIPIDANGMVIEQLEAALQEHTPSLVYTIPSYHNPTGYSLSAERRRRLMANGVVSSGGSLSHFSSQVVRHALNLGLQDQHLQHLRSTYRARVEAMDQALTRHLSDVARWQKPRGGYFFWLQMPEGFDAVAMRRKAPEFKTGFQAGSVFSTQGQFGNCIRLSFAHYNEEQIDEGIGRIAALLSWR